MDEKMVKAQRLINRAMSLNAQQMVLRSDVKRFLSDYGMDGLFTKEQKPNKKPPMTPTPKEPT